MDLIKTPRLTIRGWQDSDLMPFAELCGDPHAMRYFPNTLSVSETQTLIDRICESIVENGFGFWAAELSDTREFIGFIGIHKLDEAYHFAPGVEIGWRLKQQFWGKGLAPEGAAAVLDYAFNQLNLDEVVALTAVQNTPSQRVMQKLGMIDTGQNFNHPKLDSNHNLAEHVLYRISRKDFTQS